VISIVLDGGNEGKDLFLEAAIFCLTFEGMNNTYHPNFFLHRHYEIHGLYLRFKNYENNFNSPSFSIFLLLD